MTKQKRLVEYLTVEEMVNRGIEAQRSYEAGDAGAFHTAERYYSEVLNAQPDCAIALNYLGGLYAMAGRHGVAATLQAASVQLEPNDASLWSNMGVSHRRGGRIEAARMCFQKALALNPIESSAAYNMVSTYINQGEPEKAMEWAETAADVLWKHIADTEDKIAVAKANGKSTMTFDALLDDLKSLQPRIIWNLSQAELELGMWGVAWDHYEFTRPGKDKFGKNYTTKHGSIPMWSGEKDAHVLVFGEQGIGDEVLFATCFPDLARDTKAITFDCHTRLKDAFARTFPDVTVHGTREEPTLPEWVKDSEATHKLAIGSLPKFYRRSRAAFPNLGAWLKPNEKYVEQYRKRGPRVGISWIGGGDAVRASGRSIPIEDWGPILKVPGIEFVSLQYTDGAAKQVEWARKEFGAHIEHDQEMIDDLDRQIACIAGLDLVITVMTAVVHFAGAQAKECWVLTPRKCHWQFAQDDFPWYGSVEIVRQPEFEWKPVVEAIATRLSTWAQDRAKAAA